MTFIRRTAALATTLSLSLVCIGGALPVHAQGFGGTLKSGLEKAAPAELKAGETDLSTIIGRVISSLIGFVGVLLFVYLLYGGFIWMTAGGEKTKVETATSIIRNAVIGIIIVGMSYALASFIINELGTATQKVAPAESPPAPK